MLVKNETYKKVKDYSKNKSDLNSYYEVGRYIYKGARPNNYITFSGETWRIISAEADNTIKIMRNESIGDLAWDTSLDIASWGNPATLNTYLNEEYLKTLSDFVDVVSHTWNIGIIRQDNNDLSAQIADENATTWNGNIGLITVSEYLRVNTNTEQCGTVSLNNTNKATCKTTNWMFSIVPASNYLWTISPSMSRPRAAFVINGYPANAGGVGPNSVNSDYAVVPVLYLSSDITLSGTGTSSDPYVITN